MKNSRNFFLSIDIEFHSLLLALATCCAISYYAHVIIADYYDRHIMPNTSDHLIYGHSLYLGWVSMGINFLSGLLLISLESGKMNSRSKRPSLPPYGTQLGKFCPSLYLGAWRIVPAGTVCTVGTETGTVFQFQYQLELVSSWYWN